VDPAEPEALRGAVSPISTGEDFFFVGQEKLATLLLRLQKEPPEQDAVAPEPAPTEAVPPRQEEGRLP
jgi:hypothetical protein